MLQLVDMIDPAKYEMKLEDIKMIKVWRAEANFLRCFEDQNKSLLKRSFSKKWMKTLGFISNFSKKKLQAK